MSLNSSNNGVKFFFVTNVMLIPGYFDKKHLISGIEIAISPSDENLKKTNFFKVFNLYFFCKELDLNLRHYTFSFAYKPSLSLYPLKYLL